MNRETRNRLELSAWQVLFALMAICFILVVVVLMGR